jgi:hypothetical protein
MTDATKAAVRPPETWGLLAEFDTVDTLLAAVEKVRDAGYVAFDAYAPFPIHGLDESMGIRMSRLPWLVAGGCHRAAAGLLLQDQRLRPPQSRSRSS